MSLDPISIGVPDRVLSPEECFDAGERAAANVDLAEHVIEDPHQRIFERLWQNDHSEAWLVSFWEPKDTGYHDHSASSGGIYVIEGRVTEEPLVVGGAARIREYGPGDTFSFGTGHIHRMHHDPEAVTVHVYSPRLETIGSYDIVDGELRRTPCSPDEESPASPGLDRALQGTP
jgi:quercetin dioxygenase-like cupin family protein